MILSDATLDDLAPLAALAEAPFANILGLTAETVERRWTGEATAHLQQQGSIGIVAKDGGRACGFVAVTPLPWETRVLGKPLAALRCLGVVQDLPGREGVATELVGEAVARARTAGMVALTCKTTGDDDAVSAALTARGFRLMDTLVDFVYDVRRHQVPPEADAAQRAVAAGFTIRPAMPGDLERLMETARASFTGHFGRFHADPRIGPEQGTRVYEEWIRSCVNGWADWIVVAEKDNRIAGYSAWKHPSESDLALGIRLGHYSIAGIHPDFFGHGLFTALTREGLMYLSSRADFAEGPTHEDNHPVIRGYLKLGWTEAGRQRSYHKWLDEDG